MPLRLHAAIYLSSFFAERPAGAGKTPASSSCAFRFMTSLANSARCHGIPKTRVLWNPRTVVRRYAVIISQYCSRWILWKVVFIVEANNKVISFICIHYWGKETSRKRVDFRITFARLDFLLGKRGYFLPPSKMHRYLLPRNSAAIELYLYW